MDNRTAFILLNMIQGLSPGKIHSLLSNPISAADLFTLSERELRNLPGMTDKVLQHLKSAPEIYDYSSEIMKSRSAGISIITLEDEAYPPLLRNIYDPPLCLYIRGSMEALVRSRQSIAMVGSRHTTSYGEKMGRFLAGGAASANWPVISGLARGIDTVVHQASVDQFGCTIAVLGSGLFNIYPPENLGLARSICDSGGAVISEFPLSTKPDRYNFPVRNRVISGMSRGTIVIEAGLQSGSLITARCAAEQNRIIFAVPGRADQPFAQGCHALLRDGAVLTESFQNVLDEFSLLPGIQNTVRKSAAVPRPCRPEKTPEPEEEELPATEYSIWAALNGGEMSLDDLIGRIDMPASKIISSVLLLEMKQLVTQLPGKRIAVNPRKKARKIT